MGPTDQRDETPKIILFISHEDEGETMKKLGLLQASRTAPVDKARRPA